MSWGEIMDSYNVIISPKALPQLKENKYRVMTEQEEVFPPAHYCGSNEAIGFHSRQCPQRLGLVITDPAPSGRKYASSGARRA